MPNEKNLIPYRFTSDQSREEAARNGAKGGRASGEARRKKRTMRAAMQQVLDLPVYNDEDFAKLSEVGIPTEDIDNRSLLAAVIFKRAAKGSVMAFHEIADLLGDEDDTAPDDKPFELPARLIAPAFVPAYIDLCDEDHTEYCFPGGRGSGKSSFVSLVLVTLIKNNPDMHALCVRKIAATLRDSVYAQIVWAIGALGLASEFDCKVSPMEITYLPTGQKIFFRGADDPVKLKSIKPPFGYIGTLWLEELDQFAGDEECRSIQQSAIRGGDKAFVFKSFNPPRTRSNWANKYIDTPKPGRLVAKSDYRTVPEKWLGRAFLDEAAYLQELNPGAYEHEYLGVANSAGGMVFENIRAETITEEQLAQFDRIVNGVDWGYYPDPWAFNRCHYDAARRTLYIFDELTAYKQSNQKTAEQLLDRGLTREDKITADSAEPKSVGDYKRFGLYCRGAEKGPGSVEYSMKWLQGLTSIVIDPARCPDTLREFSEYEYERTRDGEIVSGYPDKNNHHIDAVRYATESIWKHKGQ